MFLNHISKIYKSLFPKRRMKKRVKKVSESLQEKSPEKKNCSICNYFKKLKNLFLHQEKFLASVENEKDYRTIIRNFFAIYFVYCLIVLIIGLINNAGEFGVVEMISGFLLGIITYFIIGIVTLFACSGIIYVGILIFRGRQGFFNTFKPVTYALVIIYIYMFFSLILSLFFPVSLSSLQNIQATQDTELVIQTYKEYFSQPGAIINLIIGLISIIHAFVFAVAGLSKFQKIKKLKAGFSIILSLVLLCALIVLFGILLYFATGSSNLPSPV